MGKLSVHTAFVATVILAATILSSVAGMKIDQGETRPDGSKRAQYALPEDDLYKSPIQLALTKDGRRLYVACENSNEVLVVDVTECKVVDAVKVGRHPFGLALDPAGRRLYVGNRWDDTISVLDLGIMKVSKTIPVSGDPHQLKTDSTGNYLYVSNLAKNTITVLDTQDFKEVKVLEAGMSPFGLALSPDGRYLYASNQLSNPVPFRTPPILELTVIDAKQQFVVGRRDLFSTVIGQDVAVTPDNRFVVVALELPKNLIPETQIYQGWMVTHGFAVLESGPKGKVAYFLLDDTNLYYADPYGQVLSPDGRYLYISSSGVDVVSVVNMEKIYGLLKVADGKFGISEETIRLYARHLGLSSDYVEARIPTGNNPKDLAISPDGRWLFVANRLNDTIQIVDTARRNTAHTIDLGGPKKETPLRRGEKLFNYSTISFQKQLSCNTCHPEYHLDGLLYDIVAPGDGMGQNLVDNRTQRGISFTDPYKWSGKNPTLARQDGPRAAMLFFRSHGFEKDQLQDVVHFVESLAIPPNRSASPDGALTETQEEGKLLFERARTNDGRYIPVANRCVTCHRPPYYTDQKTHNVGTRAAHDTDAAIDTPQLSNVYEGPPFLHDGRCYSLEEIWTTNNPDDQHGVSNDMDKRQLNVLIEYLKGLTSQPAFSDEEFLRVCFPPIPGSVRPFAATDLNATVVQKAKYMGNRICAGCHVKQYKAWLGTRHASSFVILQTQMAMMIGEKMGMKASNPQYSFQCLRCHGTGAEAPPEYRAQDFYVEEGLQCERCHGPGEHYASAEVMKDREQAMSKGLRFMNPQDCQECHRPKPSHAMMAKGPFDYAASWKKISH
jgi:YVTN family beta-propeller protein